MLHQQPFSIQFPTAETFQEHGYPDNYQDCLPLLEAQINTFLDRHQLVLSGYAGYTWDEREQCFQYSCTVQSTNSTAPHPLSGRTLRVKLKNKVQINISQGLKEIKNQAQENSQLVLISLYILKKVI